MRLALLATVLLAACATVPKLHTLAELSTVADLCGVGPNELAQQTANPKLLYLLTPTPSQSQLDCVTKWSRKRGHVLVFVEAVDRIEQ